jgi:hypothetical protein
VIAVALLTCDRYDYTRRTLETFAQHNDLSQFKLLHADDASTDPRIVPLVQSYGFSSVVEQRTRRGWLHTRTWLMKTAVKVAPWVLYLENDIETDRPFPWDLFRFIAKTGSNVSSLRLYGRYKDRDRKDACLTRYKGTKYQNAGGGTNVTWRPLQRAPEASQIAYIHWSAQPSVTRTEEVLEHHMAKAPLRGWTVRVKKNVMFHIGTERTAPLEQPQEMTC